MTPVTLAELDPKTRALALQQIGETEGTTALATVEPRPLPRHDGQSVSPSNPEGWSASVTVQGLRWRLCQLDELTEHPLNKKIYGDQPPSQELIDSIRNMGVLSPIIINADRQILSGTQRWKALKILADEGVADILSAYGGGSCVYAICAKQSNGKGLAGERLLIEANRQRVKTPEQKAREFTELKRIESELAKQREKQGRAKLPHPETAGKARDKAAAAVNLSGRTAEKLEKVVAAADAGDAVARTELNALNSGESRSVDAAYKAVVAPKPPKNLELVAKIQAHEKATTDLKILLKKNGIDADVSRSKADGKFHVIWHDVTAEQIQKFAETFKSSVITSLENIG